MAWWMMPAVMVGTGLYVRNKVKSAKFKWLNMTEEEVKQLPTIYAIGKAEGGDALPEPPAGFRWKPLSLIYAASPFAAQSEFLVYVVDKAVATPVLGTGTEGYLGAGDLAYFLTAEYVRAAPRLGQGPWLTGLGTTASAAAQSLKAAITETRRGLAAHGMSITPIYPGKVRRGDFIVTRDCSLGQVISTPQVYGVQHVVAADRVYPKKNGNLLVPYKDILCAFGVRRVRAG